MVSIPTLLHDTIKDLHHLSEFRDKNEDELREYSVRVVRHLLLLLESDRQKSHKVTIETSVFLPFEATFFSSNESLSTNVCHFLHDRVESLTPDTMYHQLLVVLAEETGPEPRPVRIKETYSRLVSQFSTLVYRFTQLHSSAEAEFLLFLSKCFTLEQSYYSNLRSRIDVYPDLDTEKIINALDSFIDKPQAEITTQLLESMFSYEEMQQKASAEEVGFRSSDSSLNSFYSKFLQLSLLKLSEDFQEHSSAYLKVMLNLYMKSLRAEFLEVDESSQYSKILLLVDFICSDESAILPMSYKDFIVKILQNEIKLPIPTSASTQKILESDFSRETGVQLLPSEALGLISDVLAVFESLIESGIQLNSNFPKCFRYYLILVLEQFPESAGALDFSFIKLVRDITHEIINFEATNSDEDSRLFLIVEKLHLAQDRLMMGNSQQTLLMRASLLEYLRLSLFLSKCLRDWNMKLLAVRQMDLLLEERFGTSNERKSLKKCFSRWYNRRVKSRELLKHAAFYSDTRLLTRFLNEFFIKPQIQIAAKENLAREFVLKRFFKAWSFKTILLHQRDKEAIAHYTQRILRINLTKMHQLCLQRKYNVNTALQFHDESLRIKNKNLLVQILEIWRNEWQALYPENRDSQLISNRFQQLDALGRSLALRKPFSIWQKKSNLRNLSYEFFLKRKELLLRSVFSKWVSYSKIIKIKNEHILRHNHLLKQIFFTHWYTDWKSVVAAAQMERQTLLSRSLRLFKLHKLECNFDKRHKLNSLRLSMKIWQLKSKSRAAHTSKNKGILDNWAEKYQKQQQNKSKAVVVYDSKLRSRILYYWLDSLTFIDNLREVADLNFQRNILNRISRTFQKHQNQKFKADAHYKLLQESQKSSLKRKVFDFWLSIHHENFEKEAENRIQNFQSAFTDRRINKVVFKFWLLRMRQIQQNEVHLENALKKFQRSSLNVQSSFLSWVNSTSRRYELAEQADEFYAVGVYGKIWRAWFSKYARIVNYMNLQAENISDRKDYESAVAILRKWYYKHATIVSATENICNKFLDKKKRLNLKIMFELWVHKLQAKHRDILEEDYEEAELSFGSNSSPLARKNVKSNKSSSYFANETYYFSPMETSSPSPFTPVKNRASPTRLQETNQRIKLNRMDALTQHFRRANTLEDRKGSALKTSSIPRLSPPKKQVRSETVAGPPPAPNFNTLKTDANETNGAGSDSTERLDSTTEIGSSSFVDLAKSLQRIKPIVIPSDESPKELSYSSLSTLKERLQSAQSSPIRRSKQNNF
ncbi:hypothetical protein PUMCH_001767 [Australozyma saopauloensis]|uniref:Sfi1 spindle body domain-containing protein n=1 Tax=Australozyma saopauloensis TaxID=291208 RepID=A0AAX4H7M1_9ASCO|nr:hypothetical protein PUMCH_001767 [[Candida] saopauloensis]